MRKRGLARSLATFGLAGLAGGAGVGELIGAGEELAGDRGGGDLLAAAAGRGLVAGGEVRVAPGGLRGLARHPADPGALQSDVSTTVGAKGTSLESGSRLMTLVVAQQVESDCQSVNPG